MSAGPLLNSDGSLTLEVGIYDIKGTCWMAVPVRLAPSGPGDASARGYTVSGSDCVTALIAAARKAQRDEGSGA